VFAASQSSCIGRPQLHLAFFFAIGAIKWDGDYCGALITQRLWRAPCLAAIMPPPRVQRARDMYSGRERRRRRGDGLIKAWNVSMTAFLCAQVSTFNHVRSLKTRVDRISAGNCKNDITDRGCAVISPRFLFRFVNCHVGTWQRWPTLNAAES
jgi:hypothetical protein